MVRSHCPQFVDEQTSLSRPLTLKGRLSLRLYFWEGAVRTLAPASVALAPRPFAGDVTMKKSTVSGRTAQPTASVAPRAQICRRRWRRFELLAQISLGAVQQGREVHAVMDRRHAWHTGDTDRRISFPSLTIQLRPGWDRVHLPKAHMLHHITRQCWARDNFLAGDGRRKR